MLAGRLLCWLGRQWRLGTHETNGPGLGQELQLLTLQRAEQAGLSLSLGWAETCSSLSLANMKY